MSKNLKRVYLTLAIALLIGMGLYTYLNHIPKAEAFGYESMVFCILGYLAYRPFSKQDEFRVIVFTFLTMALLRGTALLPQFSFNNMIITWGWCVLGLIVVCLISFVARKPLAYMPLGEMLPIAVKWQVFHPLFAPAQT